ncbi:iron ABC transporter permease [Nitriliruptoraceae bacterium ZYF776]|nr:iron ABC transporter permease [Profundirhabdus halotolerans]
MVPTPPRRPWKVTALLVGLTVGLVVVSLVAAGTGQVRIPPGEVLASVLQRLGRLVGADWGAEPAHPNGDAALWVVRFPRVALAVLVGASLGTAGAVMQGVFGNPLAEPGIVGVSSGAAVGAATAIVVGGTFVGGVTIAASAFVAGLITTLAVYLLSRANGRTEVVTLVLTGVAINAFAGGALAFLTFLADTAAREQIVFWQLGSLNGTTWQAVVTVLPFAALGIGGSMVLAGKLDLLALGERSARHLGVDVERLRLTVVTLVALMVAAGVAFSGIIAFVGLVIPHLVRMLVGPGHRVLVPASALGGALVLVAADLFARTAVANADLPIGMLTSIVGGPFFFWLLRRTRARAGGWG